jgi:hypothetical protein
MRRRGAGCLSSSASRRNDTAVLPHLLCASVPPNMVLQRAVERNGEQFAAPDPGGILSFLSLRLSSRRGR